MDQVRLYDHALNQFYVVNGAIYLQTANCYLQHNYETYRTRVCFPRLPFTAFKTTTIVLQTGRRVTQ